MLNLVKKSPGLDLNECENAQNSKQFIYVQNDKVDINFSLKKKLSGIFNNSFIINP